MGDIADMMLEGTLCEGCGMYLPGESIGIPRRCRDCKKDLGHQHGMYTPVKSKKVQCVTCKKWVKKVGLKDHMRDAHKIAEVEQT